MKKSILLKEVQLFLTSYCQQDRHLSRLTVLSYRDTLKLFLNYLHKQKKISLDKADLSFLTYGQVSEFLIYLEQKRNASTSTRNQRLCALNSFLRYVLFRHPDYAESLSRAMSVPRKKKVKKPRPYLEPDEIRSLLNSVNRKSWAGNRDYLIIDFCIRTGVRVSELTGIKIEDVHFGKSSFISINGKGRKERSIPIDKDIILNLKKWIDGNQMSSKRYLFPSVRGGRLSTDSVQHLLRKYTAISAKESPAMKDKRVTPHTLRHTTAMTLLNRGVDIQIIALWLGHEQIDTTQIYLSDSMALKKQALEKTQFSISLPIKKNNKTNLDFLDEI
ncbi:MAG: integrase [Bdellovibrionaceae bacterium]|nr:integrase [Pseudobdellovibrionaceae bacterium]|tara:strand:- start:6955 stop:7947 length:993 start_codon:yes stop_codon:yes gene_type:complete